MVFSKVSANEAEVLAAVASLREFFDRHRRPGVSDTTLVDQWRRAQLLPPGDRELAAALAIIGKSRPDERLEEVTK